MTVAALVLLVVVTPLLATGLQRTLLVAVATVGVALVCAARIWLGVHFLSDVLAGLLIGIGWVAC